MFIVWLMDVLNVTVLGAVNVIQGVMGAPDTPPVRSLAAKHVLRSAVSAFDGEKLPVTDVAVADTPDAVPTMAGSDCEAKTRVPVEIGRAHV